MRPAAIRLANALSPCRFSAEHLIAPAAALARLDYRAVVDPSVQASLEWQLEGGGTLHGFAAWFDTELTEGIGFSNSPSAPPAIYGHTFFPLTEPLPVSPRDRVKLHARADLVAGSYVWSWRTSVSGPSADGPRLELRQSSLGSLPLSPDGLRRTATLHRPELGSEGRIVAWVLGQMDGGASLNEISERLCELHPSRFLSLPQALDLVSELSRRYSV
jgi:hypothetical protein